MLNASHANPASILYWLGQIEVGDIANEYNLSDTFNKSSTVQMIWTSFENNIVPLLSRYDLRTL